MNEATALIETHGLSAVTYLKDQIFSALRDHDDIEAMRLDAILQSVEKILGMPGLDGSPGSFG